VSNNIRSFEKPPVLIDQHRSRVLFSEESDWLDLPVASQPPASFPFSLSDPHFSLHPIPIFGRMKPFRLLLFVRLAQTVQEILRFGMALEQPPGGIQVNVSIPCLVQQC